MSMLYYLNFPSWLKPEIIKGLPIRWYGLMYIAAFAVTILLFRYQVKEKKMKLSDDDISNYFTWGIIGLIIGARLFSVFIYSDERLFYLTHPWMIFSPFRNGRFTGLQGFSYHGGLVGAVLGFVFYSRKRKWNVLELGDMVCVAVPLGYTAGRFANFINGELYGKVSRGPLAMVFPSAPSFDTRIVWVKETAAAHGMDISGLSAVNLPRFPSQLYEAFLEGILLWLILWFVFRKRNLHHGAIISLYLIGYGFFRFIVEYLREPDENLGYILSLGPGAENFHLFQSLLNFSMGQLLCLLMILAGIGLFFLTKKFHREPEKKRKK